MACAFALGADREPATTSQARHSTPPLPFDLILSGSLLGAYKPDPKTYLGACAAFDLRPYQVAMVAAHVHDLEAADKHGVSRSYRRSTPVRRELTCPPTLDLLPFSRCSCERSMSGGRQRTTRPGSRKGSSCGARGVSWMRLLTGLTKFPLF